MKFYQVCKTTEAGNSAGCWFFTSKSAAEKAARDFRHDNPDEFANVCEIAIELTRAGILAALNRHASHPDNG
jgi:hypothetical protein